MIIGHYPYICPFYNNLSCKLFRIGLVNCEMWFISFCVHVSPHSEVNTVVSGENVQTTEKCNYILYIVVNNKQFDNGCIQKIM